MISNNLNHTAENKKPTRNYVFTVELMMEAPSNGIALERLTHLLNTAEVKDYRILNGIELGKTIEEELGRHRDALKKEAAQAKLKAVSSTKEETAAAKAGGSVKAGSAAPMHTEESREIISQILAIKEKGSLVRLSINKGKGVKMNFACRVLNIDPVTYNISVYHVDEKSVYLFKLNEIDDLTEVH